MTGPVKHETVKHETVKHETVKHETVKHETVKHETVKHETVKHETVKHETVYEVIMTKRGQHLWRLVEDGRASKTGGHRVVGPFGATKCASDFPPGTRARITTCYDVSVRRP